MLGCPSEPAQAPAPTAGEAGSAVSESSEPDSATDLGEPTDAETVNEASPAATDDGSTPQEPTPEGTPEPEPAPAETPEPATSSATGNQELLPTSVVLGDESLYEGIPGEGPLTVEQVKEWLATPGVHESLSITLPLGLSLGEKQIVGIEENPLTRAKIELGRQLYFDKRLSSDGTISCASCHDPAMGYGAQTQFGVGVEGQTGNRNSPVSFNRILSGPQFWDGRAESLEAQAVGPIANPIEMANTHDVAVETVKGLEAYRVQFDAVFGADSVNIDNIGKAIATFERAIVTGPSPYDYYAAVKPFLDQFPTEDDLGELKEDEPDLYAEYEEAKALADEHPMSESAIRGRELFFGEKAGCTACHVGANFTDEKYHNLGVGMDAEEPDLGRFAVTGDEKDKGAFKTPTVRNIELTSPYMHDGSQKTLEEVVEWYARGGHPNEWLSEKIKKLDLTDQDKQDLVAFMKSLTGPFPMVETGRLPE
ncbi:MAG: c-type cytochrome [Planctomycetaceae bacterium]|nr:c-type cytochrome [Planctomycetaceae bacterium]